MNNVKITKKQLQGIIGESINRVLNESSIKNDLNFIDKRFGNNKEGELGYFTTSSFLDNLPSMLYLIGSNDRISGSIRKLAQELGDKLNKSALNAIKQSIVNRYVDVGIGATRDRNGFEVLTASPYTTKNNSPSYQDQNGFNFNYDEKLKKQTNERRVYNPFTGEKEKMTYQQAFQIVKKLIKKAKEDGYDEIPMGLYSMDFQFALSNNPLTILDRYEKCISELEP